MRIGVCGSRSWKNRDIIERAMIDCAYYHFCEPHEVIWVHGDWMAGADALCRLICEEHGWVEQPFPYMTEFGRRGGPMRNAKMVQSGLDHVLGFWDGRREASGTLDMMQQTNQAGVPFWCYSEAEKPKPLKSQNEINSWLAKLAKKQSQGSKASP